MNKAKPFFKNLLALFFVVGGLNHFRDPDFYLPLMPDYMPAHLFLVYLSGITEVIAGIMVAIPRFTTIGALFVIAHLLVFFTVHIHMIVHAERYEEVASLAGLYFRLVVQCLFIVWAYWISRNSPPSAQEATP